MQERFSKIRNVLIGVLLLNWAVAAVKIVYGFLTRSTAMSADGFHSFSDGASNIIGLIGIWIASRPRDKDHPYGHRKYETFATIVISIMLFMIAFNIIRGGVVRFIHPVVPDVTSISFIVMLCTMAINSGVFIYEYRKSKTLKSDILKADSQHTRSDILVSLSVIFTLLAVKAGFPIADTLVSMVIALFIAYSAYQILKESSDVLCDRAPILPHDIRDIVLSVERVKECHNIRTRGRQDDIHLDLHILVDRNLDVNEAHDLNHKIQDAIKSRLRGVTDIAIHIEPYKEE